MELQSVLDKNLFHLVVDLPDLLIGFCFSCFSAEGDFPDVGAEANLHPSPFYVVICPRLLPLQILPDRYLDALDGSGFHPSSFFFDFC